MGMDSSSDDGPAFSPVPKEVDWMALAIRVEQMKGRMNQDPAAYQDLRGYEFLAEVLRRALGHTPGQGIAPESVSATTGLMTRAEAMNKVDGARFSAAEELRQLRADAARANVRASRTWRDIRSQLASSLREWCNDRTVPGKYRQEGVQLAADWLDGKFARRGD